jgi:hypothetical protein
LLFIFPSLLLFFANQPYLFIVIIDTMGVYMSCFSIRDDTDTRSLAHVEDKNNTKQPQCEDSDCPYEERNCPYPLPDDPTEISR